MDKKQLTIKEIASMAGVSVSTVSRVLNNKAHVNPAKRKKIQAIIDQSGFQPSMIARGMVYQRTNTLGVVVSDITNPYFTALVSNIEAVAEDFGFSLLLFNTMTAGHTHQKDTVQIEITAFRNLQEKKVDGVLILGGEIDQATPDPHYITALEQMAHHLPVVIVAQPVKGVDCEFVPRYQQMSAEMITEHLLASGYKNIAFLGGQPDITITNERLSGYRKMMTTYADYSAKNVLLSDYYVEDGYQGMRHFIDTQQVPEAIVAINDQVALGAIRALNDHQLSCPDDVAIGSCDAFPNGNYFTPRLTTIDHHNEDLANIAVNKLLTATGQEKIPPIPTPALPTLIIRESSGHPLKKKKE
ncbi:LacI family DNA-binding transcriptional regulator [Schleiferilactobacillus perolens]|uniref:Laci family transcriptional regulator n=1 Tax=Schleiferilactobacillus perolens DSM 12744 TaxID=1423792 RepID=A0A0R1N3H8_9LACO|nr:LacI family DNA-binding transcriptional regulator [Schleiferilactobacillus perolens]KRL14508.1 laci family transcriptional regulator [Schleiferilactobacillus perolens DSM 12744]